MIDEDQLIAPRPDVDFRNLSSQPTPEDFFLLSRVTGTVSVKHICAVSGLGREKTLVALQRLLEVGLLQEVDAAGNPIMRVAEHSEPSEVFAHEWTGRPVSEGIAEDDPVEPVPFAASGRFDHGPPIDEPNTAELFGEGRSDSFLDDDSDIFAMGPTAHRSEADEVPPGAADSSSARRGRRATSPGGGRPASSSPVSQIPVAEKSERPRVVDPFTMFPASFSEYESPQAAVPNIDVAVQREIHFVFEHLDQIDFYQLFGVERDADRKQIRSAYFRMSKRFHPDKFFREDPEGIGARVETIFKFVTKAYDTLSKAAKRKEYDRALSQLDVRVEQEEQEDTRKKAMAADMLERRGVALENRGDLVKAAGEFKKVAALRRDPRALLKAANLLLRANQSLDDAANLARGACKQLQDEVEPRLILGQIYEKNEMYVEALSAFEEAMELAPDDPSVRVHTERVRSHLR